MKPHPLPAGYEIKEVPYLDFFPTWQKLGNEIFEDSGVTWADVLSKRELNDRKVLNERIKDKFRVCLVAYFEGQVVGWSVGDQVDSDSYYMRNSALLPGHRRKGIYTELIKQTLQKVNEAGFQRVFSRHQITNSDVIIAKLKAGFMISGMDCSETFGSLIVLCHIFNPLRKKIFEFQAGAIPLDPEISKAMKFSP